MLQPLNGLEGRLKQFLYQEQGQDWFAEHDIYNRSVRSILEDAKFRKVVGPFVRNLVMGIGRDADTAEDQRRESTMDRDDGKEYEGKPIKWPVTTGFRPFSEVKDVLGLRLAVKATVEWSFGLRVMDNGEAVSHPSILLLMGVPGCGKTMLAKAAYRSVSDRSSVLFITEHDIFALLHEAMATHQVDAVMEELCGIPNLIYDDFGTEAMTKSGWDETKRDAIISARRENHETCRTLITTNLETWQIKKLSPRIYRRITDKDMAVVVGITAPNFTESGG